MSDEKPSVRLFLSDIFQEFPPANVRPGFGRRNPIARDDPWHNEWSGDWRTNWPNDWAGNSADGRFTGNPDPTDVGDLLLRHEDFGGIAYSPYSKRVYSFNQAGFDLLKKIQAGTPVEKLMSESITEDDLRKFAAELNRLGISKK